MAKKTAATPVEHAIAVKQKALKRMDDEIADIKADAEERIERVRKRQRVAQALLQALQKGTLTV
jgi:tellurite resistance protein